MKLDNTYELIAKPWMISVPLGDEVREQLAAVTFSAICESEEYTLLVLANAGLMVKLTELVPPQIAVRILLDLKRGKTTFFRDGYRLETLQQFGLINDN